MESKNSVAICLAVLETLFVLALGVLVLIGIPIRAAMFASLFMTAFASLPVIFDLVLLALQGLRRLRLMFRPRSA